MTAVSVKTPLFVPVYPVAPFDTTVVEPEITPFNALNADVELTASVVTFETLPPIVPLPVPDVIVSV